VPGEQEPGRRPFLRTSRLEAFSDGVFAIAITILVLELSVPPGSGDDLLTSFLEQWPSYLAYLVSFATIGAAWIAHTAITGYVDRTDSRFARLNLLLLLVVSFLPFPTRLLAEYITEEAAVRVAATILGINLLLIAAITSWLWRHAVSRSLVRPDAADDEVRVLTQRLTPGLAGYAILILLGLFLPLVAVFGYLVIALVLILPLGRAPT
jgi:uncharacterized membrane protein